MPDVMVELRDEQRTPCAAGRVVAEIVRACHDKTIDAGLAALAEPNLTRDTLEPILTYCAERRCVDR